MAVNRALKSDAPRKYDVSNRSHDEISTSTISTLDRFLIPLSGIPVDFAHQHGQPQELSDLRALGIVLLGSSALSATTATVGLHLAMGDGGFHPWYALAGLFVGGLTGAIDYVVQYKGTLNSRGHSELRRAGLKLPDTERATRIPFFVRLVRVGQAATFGFLGGTFLFIAANISDIHSHIDAKFMGTNRTVAEEVSKLVDGGIARSKQALAIQDTEVANLSRSIQSMRSNDVKRVTGRKANAPPPPSNPQLDALERRLTETAATRDKLAVAVSKQEEGRNAAIEKAINESPNAVRKRAGLAAQIEAISALTAEDPKLLVIVLALEFLSLALELGPMWAAATKLPSALAARLARDHFVEVTSLATEGAVRLGLRKAGDREVAEPVAEQVAAADIAAPPVTETAQPAANDNFPVLPSSLNGATPPRRGRGRPRKNNVDRTLEETGHD
jgi:hypothetical protein